MASRIVGHRRTLTSLRCQPEARQEEVHVHAHRVVERRVELTLRIERLDVDHDRARGIGEPHRLGARARGRDELDLERLRAHDRIARLDTRGQCEQEES